MTVQCFTPSCDDHIRVPGECCEYTCPGDDDVAEPEVEEAETPLEAKVANAPSVLRGNTTSHALS